MRNFQQLPGKNAPVKIIRGKFGGNGVSKAKAEERDIKHYDFMERRRLLRRESIASTRLLTVLTELDSDCDGPSFEDLHVPMLSVLKPFLAEPLENCGLTFVLQDVPFSWMDRHFQGGNQALQKVNFVADDHGDDFQICFGADGRIQYFRMDEDLW